MAINTYSMQSKAKNFLQDFTTGQKMIVLLLGAILLVGGWGFTKWVSQPEYGPLFSNIDASDSAAITSKLQSANVPYKLSDGGKSILVPRNEIYQQRINMSAEGLPSSASGGYALLDKQGITASEFRQHIDYQRAMEGELAKTIQSINGVQGASVHLVIPNDDVFSDDSRKPSAAVMVMTATGKKLNSNQVRAIVNLTSSSIEGLSTDMVTVADNQGNVLSAPGEDGGDAMGDERTSQTHDYENSVATKVQEYLAGIVGQGNALVRVSAELNFDKTNSTSETYSTPTESPVLSEDTQTESFSGNGANAVGGVLGPDASVTTNAANGTSTYTKNNAKRDLGVDKITQTVQAAPGQVKRMTVAVVINSSVKGVNIPRIQQQVTAAAGLNTERGDSIAVDSMAFDQSATKAAAKELKAQASANQMAMIFGLLKTIATVAIVAIVLFLLLKSARKKASQISSSPLDIRQLEGVRRPALAGAGGGRSPLNLDGSDTYSLDELGDAAPLGVTAEGAERIQVESQIGDLIEKQPDEVAQLLRGWLADRRG